MITYINQFSIKQLKGKNSISLICKQYAYWPDSKLKETFAKQKNKNKKQKNNNDNNNNK